MKAAASSPSKRSPSQQIDAIIKKSGGWHGERLSQLRTLVKKSDPGMV